MRNLSTPFLKNFQKSFKWFLYYHTPDQTDLEGSSFCHSNPLQRKKRYLSVSLFLAEWEGFEPSRRFWRPTPLAGEPLRPLGYHSESISYSVDCQSILAYTCCFVKCKIIGIRKRNGCTLDFSQMKWYHLAHTERCPSGLRSQSWKLVMGQPTVGSNPTLSANITKTTF